MPIIWHIHDFLTERVLAGRLLRILRFRVRLAIAVSDAVARDVQLSLPSVPVFTIQNAVDLDVFSPGVADDALLADLAGMPKAGAGTVHIGLVGTYARWKGHSIFLQAAARLCLSPSNGHLRFYVVGGPLYTTNASQFTVGELRSMIKDAGLEQCAGLVPFQTDLPRIYRALDIVVHASTRPEPFGRVIVEAMACARPVVVAAAGGAKDLVEDGTSGFTYAPGDVEALVATIQTLVDSVESRERLARGAREASVTRFSRKRLGPELARVYSAAFEVSDHPVDARP